MTNRLHLVILILSLVALCAVVLLVALRPAPVTGSALTLDGVHYDTTGASTIVIEQARSVTSWGDVTTTVNVVTATIYLGGGYTNSR